MLKDWHSLDEELIPFVLKMDCTDFEKFINTLNCMEKNNDTLNKVENFSTFWLMNSRNEIIGVANIRHKLNGKLFNQIGHIAYGIRPSMRNRGYATALLEMAIKEGRNMGIEQIRITCSSNNIGSERVILKNGGVFDIEIEVEGVLTKFFWVK